MRKPRWLLGAVLVVGLLASSAYADQWRGILIMPKSAQVSIEAENGEPVSMYDIAWPATVTRTKGRFLWVQDDGGYSPARTGGWIYTDDAIKFDAARDHFSDDLRASETAWSYWMRGICWERLGEPGVAIVDYQNALRIEPNTGIDDIHIRLGRLIAQEQLLSGRGYYDPDKRETWESSFQRAQQINPKRPQLFYDWGYALSQACACTQARAASAARKSALASSKAQSDKKSTGGGNPSKAQNPTSPGNSKSLLNKPSKRPLVAARGIESDADTPGESPLPAQRTKPGSIELPAQKSAEVLPPGNLQPSGADAVSASILAPVGPSPEGAQAAVDALEKYETAESLSPNWWALPLARAELMLNQCDEESPRGDRVVIGNFKPEFLTQLLDNHKTWKSRKSNPLTAPLNAVASRGGDDDSSQAASGDQVAQPVAAVSKPPAVDVIATAVDDFNRAISLNPNAVDAYRDRAEALRLANRMAEAEQSATTACTLCNFREAHSLRTLAQICNDTGRFQKASDYALRAAELTTGDEQQRFLRLWSTYGKRTSGETAALAVASQRAGYVASRGDGDDDNGDNSTAPKPAMRIEPPPGFISRGGSAAR